MDETEEITMPLVPHYPSDEPDRPERAPNIHDLVDRILRDGGGPAPRPTPS